MSVTAFVSSSSDLPVEYLNITLFQMEDFTISCDTEYEMPVEFQSYIRRYDYRFEILFSEGGIQYRFKQDPRFEIEFVNWTYLSSPAVHGGIYTLTVRNATFGEFGKYTCVDDAGNANRDKKVVFVDVLGL